MKSINTVNIIRINTMRKLLTYRYDLFRERDMINRLQCEPTRDQKRITLASLQKIIRDIDRPKYEAWTRKWNPRAAKQLLYKEGCITKLSEVNECYNKQSLQELLKKNSKLHIVKKNTCKSCKKLHRVGCCTNYNRRNCSSAMFVLNGYLSK